MAYSPILEGPRTGPPKSWTRANLSQATAREKGLIPEKTTILSYPTAWHHNIPWKVLRDSWNIIFTFFSEATMLAVFDLYDHGNGTVLTSSVLRNQLKLIKEAIAPTTANGASGTSELWLSRLKAEGGQLGHLEEGKQMTATHSEELASIVAWQKWNIVEGPKESVRPDDPGSDNYDDFRKIDATLTERFNTIYTYYTALDNLVKRFKDILPHPCDMKVRMPAEEELIKPALQGIQPLATKPLISFQLQHWKLVTDPKFTPNPKFVDGQFYFLMEMNNTVQT